MSATIDDQIEYAERLFQTGKRRIDRPADFETKLSQRLQRQAEKDLRAIEGIIETLNAHKNRTYCPRCG